MESGPGQIWSRVLDTMQDSQEDQAWETWLRPIEVKRFTGNTLTLAVPNKFFQTWIKEHYLGLITQTLKAITQKEDVAVECVVVQAEQSPQEKQEAKSKPRQWFFRTSSKPDTQTQNQVGLNPRFAFDNFVVGPGNRFAHAASLAVAESPARSYNPLFIYGGVGLGKTHLMQAIGAYTFKKTPALKVTYISSEKFTNQLISAIQHRRTPDFRERYRNVDILLIDDIHFIAGKESTQEEFFHTFNTLYDAHKQIVLSSDRPPKDIYTLEERLVSRFAWGLVTDIQPPDLETRIAILKKKIEQNNINNVPDDVIFFIADKVKLNIRELEGALIRVVAYSSLTNEKISLDLTHSVLKDMLLEEKNISIDDIQKKVAAYFDLRILDLKSKKRNRAVVYPRQIAMYLARSLTDFSLPEIGEYFGGRDHTTVLHAYDKIRKLLNRDSKLQGLMERLTTEIRSG
jgi:chromosomal replication initiator protein